MRFWKYSGNGNDFIILDAPEISVTPTLVKELCDRHFGVGADGVLVLTDSPSADGRMQIFNADGGEAEMCGNGLRCLVTYLDQKLGHQQDTYKIQTMNALYPVVRTKDTFALEMSEIKDKNAIDLSSFRQYMNSFYVNTGVPHLVFLTNDAKKVDIKKEGAFYRYHSIFPQGTNVSFLEVRDTSSQEAYVRTYERGVEDETFSCGTGLTASALALSHWLHWKNEIHLTTVGGRHTVKVGEKVYYSGEVKFCFEGQWTR